MCTCADPKEHDNAYGVSQIWLLQLLGKHYTVKTLFTVIYISLPSERSGEAGSRKAGVFSWLLKGSVALNSAVYIWVLNA